MKRYQAIDEDIVLFDHPLASTAFHIRNRRVSKTTAMEQSLVDLKEALFELPYHSGAILISGLLMVFLLRVLPIMP